MRIVRLLPVIFASALLACGGGGGGGGSSGPGSPPSPPPPPPPPPPPQAGTGQLKFGNAAGLTYSTPSQLGVTDARGTFQYAPGETVELSIGGVVIGSAGGGKRAHTG